MQGDIYKTRDAYGDELVVQAGARGTFHRGADHEGGRVQMTSERYTGNRWELIDQACANAEKRAAVAEGMDDAKAMRSEP